MLEQGVPRFLWRCRGRPSCASAPRPSGPSGRRSTAGRDPPSSGSALSAGSRRRRRRDGTRECWRFGRPPQETSSAWPGSAASRTRTPAPGKPASADPARRRTAGSRRGPRACGRARRQRAPTSRDARPARPTTPAVCHEAREGLPIDSVHENYL